MNIYWLEKNKLDLVIRQKIKETEVVLDIGCGIRPQNIHQHLVHICCEPFSQYVEKLLKIIKMKKISNKYVVIQCDWASVIKMFPPASVDTIYLIDVIEHLPKNEALKLLKKTEKIARQQIIIFTPLGYLPQKHPDGKDAWGMKGGKMQEHRSGWDPSDFDNSWEIFATEKYHTRDNLGHFYKKPYGAFYAVKDIVSRGKKIDIWQNIFVQQSIEFSQTVSRKIKRFINSKR